MQYNTKHNNNIMKNKTQQNENLEYNKTTQLTVIKQ